MIIFFQIFPYGPPYGIFIHPLVPQRKQEKLAKVSLWPKSHSGQSVILAIVSLWPKCLSGQSVSGQNVSGQMVTLAKVSLAKVSFWPKCNSAKHLHIYFF